MGIEQQFETSQTPHVIIERIHGNVHLRGSEEARVTVTGKGNDYHYVQEGDEIRLDNLEDCHISVPMAANVTLGEIHGNAQINGVRGQVNVEQAHGNLRVAELGAMRLGRIDGDFSAHEVLGALVVGQVRGNFSADEVKGNVQLEHCDGNCTLKEIEGNVAVARVRGNFNCKEANVVTADGVHGNMNVKSIQGSVKANRVGGNVTVVEMMGDLGLEAVGGDLRVRELMGGVSAQVGGTAKLDLHELTIPFVTVQAGGDVRCRVSPALNATLELHAGNAIILKDLPIPTQGTSRQVELIVGEGEGRLELRAGNRIKLLGAPGEDTMSEWDMDVDFQIPADFNERATELVQQVAEQVEVQVEAFTRQLNERLAQLDTGDAIAAKVQMKVQSAMRQAEEKIADAMRRAERQAERHAERNAAREARRGVRGMPPMPPMPPMGGRPGMGMPHVHTPPPPPNAPSKPNPPSPEERMLVLKMLEEGKISVDQAEKLLGAMGSD